MSVRGLLAVSLFAFATVSPAAEIYKWVDSAGKPHFSDRPPAADQGRPLVETLYGIPKNIQERIRDLARTGITIDSITGEGRQCVIHGEAGAHVLAVAFVKRLSGEGIGEVSPPLPEKGSADQGPEALELHLLLDQDLMTWSKSQH